MNRPLQAIKLTIILLYLVLSIRAQLLCTNNCTANTPNAVCTSSGYCTCKSGFIFNCNTISSSAALGGFYSPLLAGQTYYFVLNGQIGAQLLYTTVFEDVNNANILATYLPEFYTDLGMTFSPQITYTNLECSSLTYKLSCSFKITLQNQVGTQVGSRLVLKVTASNTVAPHILSFVYSYSLIKEKSQSIFLIIGYVVGALLVLTSMIFIVLIYRKKRRNPRRQHNQQPSKLDISHFSFAMPSTTISPELIKEASSCSVCLQQFDFNSNVRITVCKHIFHLGCIDEWCTKNLSCPMCRTDLTLQNITQLKAEQQKSNIQNQWILNSLHQQGEQEPSQMRNPLVQRQSINNSQL